MADFSDRLSFGLLILVSVPAAALVVYLVFDAVKGYILRRRRHRDR